MRNIATLVLHIYIVNEDKCINPSNINLAKFIHYNPVRLPIVIKKKKENTHICKANSKENSQENMVVK